MTSTFSALILWETQGARKDLVRLCEKRDIPYATVPLVSTLVFKESAGVCNTAGPWILHLTDGDVALSEAKDVFEEYRACLSSLNAFTPTALVSLPVNFPLKLNPAAGPAGHAAQLVNSLIQPGSAYLPLSAGVVSSQMAALAWDICGRLMHRSTHVNLYECVSLMFWMILWARRGSALFSESRFLLPRTLKSNSELTDELDEVRRLFVRVFLGQLTPPA